MLSTPPVQTINDRNQVDLLLLHVSRIFAERIARSILPQGVIIRNLVWQETEISARRRRMDRALLIETDDARLLQHWEWESRPRKSLARRIFEYNVLSALALSRTANEGASPWNRPVAVESIAVLLGGRRAPWPEEGEYRTSPDHCSFSGVRFRIVPIYQRSVDEIRAMGDTFWLIFAPLARDATPEAMEVVVAQLREEYNEQDFVELMAAMIALGQKDHRKRGLHKAIISAIQQNSSKSEVAVPHWFYELGFEKGIEQGIEKGIEKGRVEEARTALKRVLKMRRLRLSPKYQALINTCTDLVTLERWLDQAIVAQNISQALSQSPPSHAAHKSI